MWCLSAYKCFERHAWKVKILIIKFPTDHRSPFCTDIVCHVAWDAWSRAIVPRAVYAPLRRLRGRMFQQVAWGALRWRKTSFRSSFYFLYLRITLYSQRGWLSRRIQTLNLRLKIWRKNHDSNKYRYQMNKINYFS